MQDRPRSSLDCWEEVWQHIMVMPWICYYNYYTTIAVSLTFWHCLYTFDYTFSYQKCILVHTSSILRSKSWHLLLPHQRSDKDKHKGKGEEKSKDDFDLLLGIHMLLQGKTPKDPPKFLNRYIWHKAPFKDLKADAESANDVALLKKIKACLVCVCAC